MEQNKRKYSIRNFLINKPKTECITSPPLYETLIVNSADQMMKKLIQSVQDLESLKDQEKKMIILYTPVKSPVHLLTLKNVKVSETSSILNLVKKTMQEAIQADAREDFSKISMSWFHFVAKQSKKNANNINVKVHIRMEIEYNTQNKQTDLH
jgi:hypothetical protein